MAGSVLLNPCTCKATIYLASPLHQACQHANCSEAPETHSCGALHRYAEGLSFQEAYRQLHKLQAEDEYSDMHYIASKLLMQHVLKV